MSPLVFHGVKLALLTKNSPTVDMRASGTNLKIVVHSWKAPMFRTPVRLIAAGIHRPVRAIRIDQPLVPPSLTKFST